MVFGSLQRGTVSIRQIGSVFFSARLFALLALSIAVFGISVSATAQQASPPVRIHHQTIETHRLPAPGTLMPITLELVNSSEVDTKIRLVGSRDGRFMDIAYPLGVLNVSDRPTYTIFVPAPVAAMTYQFIIHQKSGDLTLTEKFTIKRNCVQTYKVDVPEGIPSAEFRRKIGSLVAQARSLEQDTKNLDTAIQLIETLKKDLEE